MMRDLRWEKMNSHTVYTDRWLQLRADTCRFPDGRVIEPYYIVELPNWANIVVVTEDEKIVLVRQYRYPVDQVTFELPGGVIDKGEDPMHAAIREMQEETGYHSAEVEFLCKLAPNPAINDNTAYFYEDIDVMLFSKSEFLRLLHENKMQHGVQLGPIYEALIKLNWLTIVGSDY
jgi:ADP-ribose pyrophosphatase